MALALTTITDAIAALTITGVNIRALDEIPNAIYDRDCPVLLPAPPLVSDLTATRMTQIKSTTTGWNVEYVLNYVLLYAPLGSGRGLDLISPTLTTAFTVIDAVIAAVAGVSGAVTFYLDGISSPGPQAGPDDTQFFGVQFSFRVLEMIN